jgi:hypothetical protein
VPQGPSRDRACAGGVLGEAERRDDCSDRSRCTSVRQIPWSDAYRRSMPCDDLVRAEFEREMRTRPQIWRDLTGLSHWSRFTQLVNNRGGRDAARSLLHKDGLTEGFLRLKAVGRLDLTVEFLMLEPRSGPCFSAHERGMARRRLVEAGMPRASLPLEAEYA